MPRAECRFSTTSYDVRVAGAVLDRSGLHGTAGDISWLLRYSGSEPPLYLLPARLYRGGFPKAKSLVPLRMARYSGSLDVAGRHNRVGPLWTPSLTLLVLRHRGREHSLTSLARAVRARVHVGPAAWTFATADSTVLVTGRIEAPPSAFVLLE